MLKKKKVIALLTTTMILVGSLGLSAYGASITKNLKAYYGTSRIIVDGKDVTNTIEPFIVDGATYIPLRVVANTFNKKVDWNPLTSTATITDDLTQVDNYYQGEILKRDIRIMELESKIQKLEKELEEKKEISLDDLEDQLNKDHDEYRDIEFEITLSGKPSDVEVKIEVDLYDFDKEWKALTEARKVTYLQDIVDDILEAYPDADVEGYIRDIDAKKTVLEFTIDKKDKVSIDSKSIGDIDDLEEYLDDEYYNYFTGVEVSIELEESKSKVTFYVDVDGRKYETKWNALKDSAVESFMEEIAEEIEDEMGSIAIEGIVYDTYYKEDLAEYSITSSGKTSFYRY